MDAVFATDELNRASRRLLAFVALSIVLALPCRAYAGDAAAAQVLFDDAKRLMSQRQYALACARFEESQREDPGIGTLFHLATCHERLGKSATAWAEYLEVAAQAHTQGEAAREGAARERAAALEPKVPRLAIDPGAAASTQGLELRRDGVLIGQAQWRIAVPVDPGDHKVEARAPGVGPWTVFVHAGEGAHLSVTVPVLAEAPSPVAAAPEAEPVSRITTTTAAEIASGTRGTGQRVAGVLIAVVGGAGIGTGAYFGLLSKSHHDDALSHCAGNVCDAAGVSLRDDARRAGDAATVAFVVGGAALLGGILIYVTAPRASQSFAPQVAVGPGSVVLQGRW